jgi:hypothetical protein
LAPDVAAPLAVAAPVRTDAALPPQDGRQSVLRRVRRWPALTSSEKPPRRGWRPGLGRRGESAEGEPTKLCKMAIGERGLAGPSIAARRVLLAKLALQNLSGRGARQHVDKVDRLRELIAGDALARVGDEFVGRCGPIRT